MFSEELYRINPANVTQSAPDFYILMGDDINVSKLMERGTVSSGDIDRAYQYQKSFTDILDCPVYPVIGNHEQIAGYMLTGRFDNPAEIGRASCRERVYVLV